MGPGAEQFPVFPGQQLLLQFYACAITCGHSFMVLSVWGIKISFWSVLLFSSPFYFYNRIITIIIINIIIIIIIIIIVIIIIIIFLFIFFIDYYCTYYFHEASGSV